MPDLCPSIQYWSPNAFENIGLCYIMLLDVSQELNVMAPVETLRARPLLHKSGTGDGALTRGTSVQLQNT